MDKHRKFNVTFAAYFTLIGFQNITSVPIDCESNGIGFNKLVDTSKRIDIIYDRNSFKEINSGVLQFVGHDVSEVSLSGRLASDKDAFLSWKYHGIEERNVRRVKSLGDENGLDLDLSSGPPVVRMECFWRRNKTISNNTLIYTGENQSPYLFKHGKTLRATVSNPDTAHLPCLLKYPLDENNSDGKQLQLFKDGKLVKSDALSYIPELGYQVNLTGLENPLGTYECRVINGLINDVVFVELDYDSFINVRYKGYVSSFYAGAPYLQPFECKLPKNMFENTFQWSYLWNTGKYSPLHVTNTRNSYDSFFYTQTIMTTFPDANIIGVVCSSSIEGSESLYNSSYRVYVKRPNPPKILNNETVEPIIYTSGMNLSCSTNTEPVSWTWLKNGNVLNNGEHIIENLVSSPFRSTLVLNQVVDEIETNYTCIVSNFLGQVKHNFRVRLNTTQQVVPNCNTTIENITSENNYTNCIVELAEFVKLKELQNTLNSLINNYLNYSMNA